MSKDVLISICPQWVEKIASGEKTIEVRKTKPKQETPFKCHIYCTNDKNIFLDSDINKKFWTEKNYGGKHYYNGKVIGEFICDRIICSQGYFDSHGKNHLTNVFEEDIKGTCLTEYELWNYIAGKAVKANEMYDGYLWHISDLKIYDKPKELSEFKTVCKDAYYNGEDWFCNDGYGSCKVKDEERPDQEECAYFDCPSCGGESNEYADYAYCMCNGKKPITRPPQSWGYVEEL